MVYFNAYLQRYTPGLFYYINIYQERSYKLQEQLYLTLLESKFKPLRQAVLYWVRFIANFRVLCFTITDKMGEKNLNICFLFFAIITSRLGMPELYFVVFLFLVRFEPSFVFLNKFYKRQTTLLPIHFPSTGGRSMQKAAKVMVEAAQNPVVQATVVGIAGMVVWKTLDVHDTYKNAEISADTNATTERIAHADRLSAAEQAEADRIASAKQAAYDKYNSPEFKSLSPEQQDQVKYTVKTGEYKVD